MPLFWVSWDQHVAAALPGVGYHCGGRWNVWLRCFWCPGSLMHGFLHRSRSHTLHNREHPMKFSKARCCSITYCTIINMCAEHYQSLKEPWLWSQDLPGSIFAKVKRVESFATKQEEKTRAASFWCNWASSCSRATWKLLVPEMFLVPPAPAPWLSKASLTSAKW